MTRGAPSRTDVLRSPVRQRLVSALSDLPAENGLDAHQLAERVGLHVTTVRWHLDRLEGAGVLSSKSARGSGAGRPRKLYRLTAAHPSDSAPGADPERDHRSLQLLTGLLTEAFAHNAGQPVTPEEAGRQWARDHVDTDASADPARTAGEWLSKIGGLTDVLDQWGYTPTITTSHRGRDANIRLTHCPFRDLARANPAVVCGIHLGLIRGTMEKLGESSTAVDLTPFAEGNVCIAHLTQNRSAGIPPRDTVIQDSQTPDNQTPDNQAKES